ncbi:MAG: FecR domain-containing protein [Cyanobacteria bacterium Co-bin13]|nr:FecR domain-containing protein [Cyanobacteria bacterium Co-bin13]
MRADVALTRADIDVLLNRVELIPRGRSARPARLSDFLGTGDALRTAAQSRAELRFNDGSLARVGEQATFRFTPNTRNFRLTNGTVLLLIPPGQGRTTIQTPNAVTGIQGSALVVRHIPGRNLTLVMALTNNPAGPMTVTSQDGTQTSALYAGQMALVQPNRIEIVEFDLSAFHQTSDLVDGLRLSDESFESHADDPLQPVREETRQALNQQAPFNAQNAVLAPDLIRADGLPATPPEETRQLITNGSGSNQSSNSNQLITLPSDPVTSAEREPVETVGAPIIASPAGDPTVANPSEAIITTPTAPSGIPITAEAGITPVPSNPLIGTPVISIPAVPGIPETPTISLPAIPEKPAAPEPTEVVPPTVPSPVEPGVEVTPTPPVTPGNPGGGATPATPATPADPGAGTPAVPATPATPANPGAGTPATPATPADPGAGTPAVPATPATPAGPGADIPAVLANPAADTPVAPASPL